MDLINVKFIITYQYMGIYGFLGFTDSSGILLVVNDMKTYWYIKTGNEKPMARWKL